MGQYIWTTLIEPLADRLSPVKPHEWTDDVRRSIAGWLIDEFEYRSYEAANRDRVFSVMSDVDDAYVHTSTVPGHRGPKEAAQTIIGEIIGQGTRTFEERLKKSAKRQRPVKTLVRLRERLELIGSEQMLPGALPQADIDAMREYFESLFEP